MSYPLFRFGREALGLLILFGWAYSFVPLSAQAATKAEQAESAEQLVAEALHREIYGQEEARDELLKQALDQPIECKPALWHTGHVKHGDDWVDVNDVPAITAEDKKLARYQAKRDEAEDSATGQLQIANWCKEQHLSEQERAHLTRVLEHDPDNVEARRRLGFVRVGDEWLTRQEMIEERTLAQREQEALATWAPKLEKLRDAYTNGSKKQREFAEQQLRAITDPTAIPAIEAVLSNHSEELAKLAVELLSNMDSSEATLSLARHAVYSRSEDVREQAAEKLQDRKMADYVPAMLSVMQLPIQTQREVLQGRGGRLTYRHAFYREGQDKRELTVLDTNYERIGDQRDTLRRSLGDVRQTALQREAVIAQINQKTMELNDRTMEALEIATGEDNVFNSPKQWWEWWNLQNEVYVSGYKELATTYREQDKTVIGRSPPPQTYDCLAAGTMVWTDAGPRSIEKIRIGDMVLSQDPETGELAYKPVLATTARPASELTKISVGDQQIMTSGGHLFWVSGDGWVKSRNLKSGNQLHGVNGAATVSVVEKGIITRTYNLVVADFHTYFVGDLKVLSHDNTVHETTENVVPGLAAN